MKLSEKSRNQLKTEHLLNLKDKRDRLIKRTAHKAFIQDISLPEREKSRYRSQLFRQLDEYDKFLPEIKKVLTTIKKKYVPQIWEQDAITAVYLLSAKVYGNLSTILELARNGKNFEINELARSSQESLDLAFLFLENGQEQTLNKWFEGDNIDNEKARTAFHRAINRELNSGQEIPAYDMKTHIYKSYSYYSHSNYSTILELVDLFHEDYDFENITGFYYTNKNLDNTVKNLVVSLLLELKNLFTKVKDEHEHSHIDALLSLLGNYRATDEELKKVSEKYR